jgi:hypothetical protein
MTFEELEAKVKMLEDKVTRLEDIDAIKKLQRAYGFYLEHWMAEDLIDLFAEGDDSLLWIAAGKFQGKESIRRFFHHGQEGIISRKAPNPEFLHQVMQLSGVVDLAPDGKTARGRWYGFGANAFPVEGGKINPGWMNGVYSVDYIKQNNVWKLWKVRWYMTFHAPWGESFVDPAKRQDIRIDRPYQRSAPLKPTGAPVETLYPSGYIAPFHFENPVSGREPLIEK